MPLAPTVPMPLFDEEIDILPMRSLNGKSFAGALQGQLAKRELKSLGERRIMRILNSPDSAKRDRQLLRMENHTRAHLDLPITAAIDWESFDWQLWLGVVLRLLLALLPLLL